MSIFSIYALFGIAMIMSMYTTPKEYWKFDNPNSIKLVVMLVMFLVFGFLTGLMVLSGYL